MDADSVRTFLYEVCIPFILILCLLAITLNGIILASRCYVHSRSTSLELTYSLALSDTYTSFVIALSLLTNSYFPVVFDIAPSFCFSLTLEAFRTGGLLTGVLHITALACVHYLQIKRPFDHTTVFTLKHAHILALIIWIVPPIALILYFSMWPGQGYRDPTCQDNSFYNKLPFRAQISSFIMILILVTCIVYWLMLLKIGQVRSKTTGASSSRSRRTLATATLIFGTFLFGWMPASILFLLGAEGMPLYENRSLLLNVMAIVSLINIMLKSLTNPVIYATRIPEIRQFVAKNICLRCFAYNAAATQRELAPLRSPTTTSSKA
ncbi:hypothetical protein WR25_22400 [Diploscapter pachys]|uniref:G-protein coupled receptors family 1 profile domain-containing protein n=1 Tax=Diploscapter pachys TaxID=2018661 RepID=A0A2A2JJE4_9BILA|nr:hypothetical protein WR25_22400 [Diploscapter pachys]